MILTNLLSVTDKTHGPNTHTKYSKIIRYVDNVSLTCVTFLEHYIQSLKNTFSSNVHRISPKIDHILGHKISLKN